MGRPMEDFTNLDCTMRTLQYVTISQTIVGTDGYSHWLMRKILRKSSKIFFHPIGMMLTTGHIGKTSKIKSQMRMGFMMFHGASVDV